MVERAIKWLEVELHRVILKVRWGTSETVLSLELKLSCLSRPFEAGSRCLFVAVEKLEAFHRNKRGL